MCSGARTPATAVQLALKVHAQCAQAVFFGTLVIHVISFHHVIAHHSHNSLMTLIFHYSSYVNPLLF